MAPHDNVQALRRGLMQFLLGKGATGLASIALLAVLLKLLPVEDFIAFSSLQAVVILAGEVASFGIVQATLRFVPEMRAQGQSRPMYALIWRTTGLRLASSALCLALFGAGLPWLARSLGLEHRLPWVWVYVAVGTLRLTGQFLSGALEALLWPRLSQLALAAAALAKLALVLGLAGLGQVQLPAVILVELACDGLALALLALGLRRRQRADAHAAEGDAGWVREHAQRLRSFGRWNYATSLLALLSSTAPYRLLAPALLSPTHAALLGVAYSVCDLFHRFLPAKMGRLLLRSVLVVQRAQGAGVASTAAHLRLSFAFNAALVATAAGALLAGGSGLMAWLSGGKYVGAGPIIAATVAVLLLDLWRVNGELLFSVTERNRQGGWINAGLFAGPAAAALLAPALGPWALPLGAAAGQALAIALCLALTARDGRGAHLVGLAPWLFAAGMAAGGAALALLPPPSTGFVVRLAGACAAAAALGAWLKPVPLHRLRQLGRPASAAPAGPHAG